KGPDKIQITGMIINEGDESALDVMIESIKTGKILLDAGTLGAGEQKEVTLEASEKDLGIELPGYHNVPLRVLYKDTNRVAFSAAFVNSYTKRSQANVFARTSPVSISLGEVIQKAGGVDIAKSGEFLVTFSNGGAAPIDINVEFVGTKEIELRTEKNKIS